MPYQVKHLAIAASAGAGKTFQLVHRFVGLLALGVAPEKIIALTFSRKAAGEMFDRVIQALAEAALTSAGSDRLSDRLHACKAVPPEFILDQHTACRLLRRLLDSAHRTRIGTLDSFLVSIVQAFPFEFGLGGQFSILEGFPASAAKQEALRHVLLAQGGADTAAGRGFLDSFKQATYGQEMKSFSDTVQQFIESYHAMLLEAHTPQLWGNPDRIWGTGGCPWAGAENYPDDDAAVLQKFLADCDLADRQANQCSQFFEALPEFSPVADWGGIKYLYNKLRVIYPELCDGQAELSLNRKRLQLSDDTARSAARLVEYITARFIHLHLERTKGLYQVLNAYEATYRSRIRQTGRLSFTDVAFLLNSHRLAGVTDATPALTAARNDADRLYVDYRLDSHFDHWLLDEFQDTSTFQWHAIENLIDEVVQDRSGQRSLFYVGDVKQAIYGWRGGDPELFQWVHRKYGSDEHGDIIEQRPLAQSWRSSQPVIDAVNGVFNDIRHHGLDIAPSVWDRWENTWKTHKTARRDEPGYTAFYALPRENKQTADDRELALCKAALEILRETTPLQRGMSAAALVRTNDQGRRLADFLRDAGIPVLYAGRFSILDNPVTAGFVSLIKIAEHPGDTYAWQHLRMTPWRTALPDNDSAIPPARFVKTLLDQIGGEGFEALIKTWLAKLDAPLTAFETGRVNELIAAAREFDTSDNRCTTDFLEFLAEYEIEDAGTPQAVQIMTTHKAKGLQFDMVLLPALDRSSGINAVDASGLHIEKTDTADRQPLWVLDIPRKDIATSDHVLSHTLERIRAAAAYEELCNLYVAMTRAKHALYLFRTEPSSSSKTTYPTTVAAAGLAGGEAKTGSLGEQQVTILYEQGDRDWFTEIHNPPPPPASPPPVLKPVTDANRTRYRRETPSSDEQEGVSAAGLFRPENQKFADFGKALHAFMSRIEWYRDDLDLEAVYRETIQEIDVEPTVAKDAFDQLRHALTFPAVQTALKTTDAATKEVWLERRFEAILDNAWVSGCFDRVVLEHDADGKPEAAVIVDYKTSVISNPEMLAKKRRSYAPQLQIYRQALARMTGLEEARIRALLIFTKTGDVVEC